MTRRETLLELAGVHERAQDLEAQVRQLRADNADLRRRLENMRTSRNRNRRRARALRRELELAQAPPACEGTLACQGCEDCTPKAGGTT